MMNKLTRVAIKTVAVLCLGCGIQSTALADDFYIGAGIYQTNVSLDGLDDNDTTPGFFLGYTFIDSSVFMLSAELGKYDLGESDKGGNDIDADAITLAAVATLPLGPFFELYAKAGLASTNVDVNGESFDGNDPFTGIGFSFDILDTIDIYAEYLRFDTEVDSEMIGVGLRLDF